MALVDVWESSCRRLLRDEIQVKSLYHPRIWILFQEVLHQISLWISVHFHSSRSLTNELGSTERSPLVRKEHLFIGFSPFYSCQHLVFKINMIHWVLMTTWTLRKNMMPYFIMMLLFLFFIDLLYQISQQTCQVTAYSMEFWCVDTTCKGWHGVTHRDFALGMGEWNGASLTLRGLEKKTKLERHPSAIGGMNCKRT